jgi:hypothetical protein
MRGGGLVPDLLVPTRGEEDLDCNAVETRRSSGFCDGSSLEGWDERLFLLRFFTGFVVEADMVESE